MKRFVFLICALSFIIQIEATAQSIAREWNDLLLESIRRDLARPTVHARNLFHTSILMYDSWSVYENSSTPYFLGQTIDGFYCEFLGIPQPANILAAQEEALSFAVYRLLKHRFLGSPAQNVMFFQYDQFMGTLGHDINYTSIDYTTGDPRALGNYLAQEMISYGLQDGSNEQNDYGNLYYTPNNIPLVMDLPGNPTLENFNSWQPLTLDVFIDQSGNVIPLNTPDFLSPEWGNVSPFALSNTDLVVNQRNGNDYNVWCDPGAPPLIDTIAGGLQSAAYQWGFSLVTAWSSHHDSSDPTMIDISPQSIGNVGPFPTTLAQYQAFYDLPNGGDSSMGHAVNPATGNPYTPQMVKRGDYSRVLAEFWADGPDSETPPGHWFTLLNEVSDDPLFVKRFEGVGPILSDLEWDVKSYFILGSAMHDSAIAAWSVKGWYDYIRPVSALRGMARLGQSTDPAGSNYHIGGVPLIPGFIDTIAAGDPLQGPNNQYIGDVKFYAWRGPGYINNPQIDEAGVNWIRASEWWPYQRPSFVTPPFAGYVSGHSTFSRAAAEVMTMLTGDAFFPGGMGEFLAPVNSFLVFEDGPSTNVTLQWATYRDASDQCSLSRIWGGIHPPADDIPGRIMGEKIGIAAFNLAKDYVTGNICQGTLLVHDIPVPNSLYEADHLIFSKGQVDNNTNVTYHAGNSITLEPNFEVIVGAIFLAEIQGCQ